MNSVISGPAYVLGDNVDTDQIIPAQYLTYDPGVPEEYRMFGKHALSSVPPAQAGLPKGHIPFHSTDEFTSPYRLIIAGRNFGCGSSREHAPVALKAAGIIAVVAESYARIFFRNAINGAHVVPFECRDRLCERLCTGDEVRIEPARHLLQNLTTNEEWSLQSLGEVAAILEAGGLFAHARRIGVLKSAT